MTSLNINQTAHHRADGLLFDLRTLPSNVSEYRSHSRRFRKLIVEAGKGNWNDRELVKKINEIYSKLSQVCSMYEYTGKIDMPNKYDALQYNSNFPDVFWQTLYEGNLKNKNLSKGTCLVLHPQTTHDVALSGPSAQELILNISRNCQFSIIFRTIQSTGRMWTEIEQAFPKKKTGEKCIFFNTHGLKDGLIFDKNRRSKGKYSINQIKKEHFNPLLPNGVVIVASCNSRDFGARLSRIAKIKTIAVDKTMNGDYSFIEYCTRCNSPELISIDPNNFARNDCVFDRNGTEISPCKTNISNPARKKLNFLLNHVSHHGLESATISINALTNLPLVSLTPAERIAFLSRGALIGSRIAQLRLAEVYAEDYARNKNSRIQALGWLQMAASQDLPQALFWLGAAHQYGGLGLLPNNEIAANYYRRAMKLGNQQARAALGSLHESFALAYPAEGFSEIVYCLQALTALSGGAAYLLATAYWNGWGGLPLNRTTALELYRKGAQMGHPYCAIQYHHLAPLAIV